MSQAERFQDLWQIVMMSPAAKALRKLKSCASASARSPPFAALDQQDFIEHTCISCKIAPCAGFGKAIKSARRERYQYRHNYSKEYSVGRGNPLTEGSEP